jgi:hypothetical protein
MHRGFVKVYRKFLDDGYIQNHKLCAFMLWSLLKATHRPFKAIIGRQIIDLEPGQFIFGLRAASKETKLSIQEIRTILTLLEKAEFLTRKTTNKFSVITILNWGIYQSHENEINTQSNTLLTHKQQHTRTQEHKKKSSEKILSEISVLKKRYSDQGIIDQAFQAIASTRKSNHIANGVRLSILQAWEKYPVKSIMTGIKTYLDRDYANQGKGERYLLGIIRNNGQFIGQEKEAGQVMRSTGSALLDNHYRSQGIRVI